MERGRFPQGFRAVAEFNRIARAAGLKPCAHADHQTGRRHTLSVCPCKPGRIANLAVIGDADIGRKFAFDLIAQAQAKLDVAEAAPMPMARISCAAKFSSTRGCKISRWVMR